ncbi:hypothetical protein AB6A40_003259 [Gnathostoma spinigerum]|uniref:OTU domain-containing protein n=1 Tax=Gnathostoma spinigerum TaxID=75299 RepID=A0ABD6E902_9BILA
MARKKELTVNKEKSTLKNIKAGFEAKSTGGSSSGAKSRSPGRGEQAAASAGSSTYGVYDVGDLRAQLATLGLTLRDIPGDGNCLFRALGDQLDGHSMNHVKHRMDTVRYMIANRSHFEPFIDVPFDRYMDNLSQPGTYAGHEALVAFARLHGVNIIIHQLNSPLWQIEGTTKKGAAELHLSYHNGEHYSSVRHTGDFAKKPARVRILSQEPSTLPCCTPHNNSSVMQKPLTSHSSLLSTSQIAYHHTTSVISQPRTVPSQESAESEPCFPQNEDDFQALVEELMLRSGCEDSSLATETLIDHGYNLDSSVDYLLSLSLFFRPLKSDSQTCPAATFNVDDDDDDTQEIVSRRLACQIADIDVNESAKSRRIPRLSFSRFSRSRTSEKTKMPSSDGGKPHNRKTFHVGRQKSESQIHEESCDRNLRFLTL